MVEVNECASSKATISQQADNNDQNNNSLDVSDLIRFEAPSKIAQFYTDKCILVTGGTGFIGKVLIEKLLRSCDGLKCIYVLMRPSNGRSASQRLDDMLSKRPFDLNLSKQSVAHKLKAIECDLSQAGLALSDTDLATLKDNVSIVFHVAASVKFDASLRENMKHNVEATRELLVVASQFSKLVSFVHVSTAYSNCQLRNIDEIVYEMDIEHHQDIMRAKGYLDGDLTSPASTSGNNSEAAAAQSEPQQRHNSSGPPKPARRQTQYSALLEHRPNTYTYTKALAESVINQYKDKLNIAIARPSIVTSAMREPAVGWVDTYNGPIGLSIMGALGILQSIDVNSEVVFDLIPVDIVANSLINIAWCIAEHPNKFASKVFNLTSGKENPCSFYEYFQAGRDEAHMKPSVRVTRPILTIPKQRGKNAFTHWLHKIFTHLLFAYIMDFFFSLSGQKRVMVSMVRKMHHANKIFEYFCSNQWFFTGDNMQQLRQLMSETDLETFNCNVQSIDWNVYARTSWLGCRRYILREDDSTIELAKRKYSKVCLAYWLAKLLLVLLVTLVAIVCCSPHLYLSSLICLPCYSIVYLL